GTNAVGTTGFLFQPGGTPGAVPANPTTGQNMNLSGVFGPFGANYWDMSIGDPNHILGYQVFKHNSLTVLLTQIVATGNISITSAFDNGRGTFLDFSTYGGPTGDGTYNVVGGNSRLDPGAYL